jgi:lipopolysaccharide export LptBFGC system permease protein LptF
MALLPDYSYVWEPELVAVDGNGLFLYRVRSDYGKIVPVSINTLEGEPKQQAALLLRALDRADSGKRREPDWTDEAGEPIDSGASQILLDLNFDDLILLSRAAEGPDTLNLRELFDAEKTLGAYGFVPEVFRAEILRRLSEPVFFLPLSVFALFLGWCFRARKKPRYVYVPMLGVLPLVFYHASLFFRNVFNNLAIWFSLSIGFSSALVCFIAASAVCFILALVVLAAQHG